MFVAGDVLLFRNEDSADHTVGPFWLPAGTKLTVPLERASTFNFLCTVHPTGSIALVVQPRNSWLRTLVPTLLVGVPMGAGLVVAVRIASRLDTT